MPPRWCDLSAAYARDVAHFRSAKEHDAFLERATDAVQAAFDRHVPSKAFTRALSRLAPRLRDLFGDAHAFGGYVSSTVLLTALDASLRSLPRQRFIMQLGEAKAFPQARSFSRASSGAMVPDTQFMVDACQSDYTTARSLAIVRALRRGVFDVFEEMLPPDLGRVCADVIVPRLPRGWECHGVVVGEPRGYAPTMYAHDVFYRDAPKTQPYDGREPLAGSLRRSEHPCFSTYHNISWRNPNKRNYFVQLRVTFKLVTAEGKRIAFAAPLHLLSLAAHSPDNHPMYEIVRRHATRAHLINFPRTKPSVYDMRGLFEHYLLNHNPLAGACATLLYEGDLRRLDAFGSDLDPRGDRFLETLRAPLVASPETRTVLRKATEARMLSRLLDSASVTTVTCLSAEVVEDTFY